MQITYFGSGKFELKSKTASIITGEEIKIADFVLPGAGEYEVAGIQAEVMDKITIFQAEDLTIAYLDKRQNALNDQEIEKVNAVDMLFIPVGGNEVFTAKQALAAISQIEPKIVIPMYYEDISEFSKTAGISPEPLDVLKITKSQIKEETEKKIVILSCKH